MPNPPLPTSTVFKGKLLTQLVDQFKERHRYPPSLIVVSPMALVILATKKSVAMSWGGIRVEVRDEIPRVKTTKPRTLGVDLVPEGTALEAVDLP